MTVDLDAQVQVVGVVVLLVDDEGGRQGRVANDQVGPLIHGESRTVTSSKIDVRHVVATVKLASIP